MHISRVVTGSAALALGALALAVPSAAAEDSGITISPRSAAPGQTVTVSTTACGPDVDYGKAFSDLTSQINLLAGDQKGTLVGTFQVPEDAAPGSSGITVKCPPRIQMTDTLTITPRPSGAAAAGSGSAADAAPRPSGAIAAGSGGTAGVDGGQVALGGVLLAGAVAGGAVKIRRRLGAARV